MDDRKRLMHDVWDAVHAVRIGTALLNIGGPKMTYTRAAGQLGDIIERCDEFEDLMLRLAATDVSAQPRPAPDVMLGRPIERSNAAFPTGRLGSGTRGHSPD